MKSRIQPIAPGPNIGGYEIIREIARSNAIIYEAYDPLFDRRIALKDFSPMLDGDLSQDERKHVLGRFERELRAMADLHHPNIIQIFNAGVLSDSPDSGDSLDRPFIAMELLEGETLRKKLAGSDAISLQEVSSLLIQLLSALSLVHEKSLVHRDLKPANIQILPGGALKLLDFGIAIKMGQTRITQTGVQGSLHYLSPEQCQRNPIDHRSDLFAVGIIAFEMLVGRVPFNGPDEDKVAQAIAFEEPLYPPSISISIAVKDFLTKALQKSPDDRFQSAKEMSSALVLLLNQFNGPQAANVYKPQVHSQPSGNMQLTLSAQRRANFRAWLLAPSNVTQPKKTGFARAWEILSSVPVILVAMMGVFTLILFYADSIGKQNRADAAAINIKAPDSQATSSQSLDSLRKEYQALVQKHRRDEAAMLALAREGSPARTSDPISIKKYNEYRDKSISFRAIWRDDEARLKDMYSTIARNEAQH